MKKNITLQTTSKTIINTRCEGVVVIFMGSVYGTVVDDML